jgi:murein DD-endopeptidase MepM/ murein hydrolase activator NlpD
LSAPGSSPTQSAPSPSPSPSTGRAAATSEQFVFPVAGVVSYAHTHHDYPATDIMAKCGSTVRAATSGVILEVTRVDRWKRSVNAGATRGGLSVSIKGDDGIRYYGSHMEFINANIKPGVRVTAGETLGKVGETGDASACHLHFGISPVCSGTGDWWIQRGVIWPWPYLDSWRRGGDKSPVAEINAWSSKNGCPTHPTVDP